MIEWFFLGKTPEQEQRESFSGLSPDLDSAAVQKNYPSEVETKGLLGQVDQWMKKAHARPSLAFGVSRGKQKTKSKGCKEPSWRPALFNLKKDQSSLKRLILG